MPETRYVRIGEEFVAYQSVGDGPMSSLWCGSAFAHTLDLIWDHPATDQFLGTVASLSRLVLVQARGTGASSPTLDDERLFEMSTRDIEAVLHVLDVEQVVVLAAGDSGLFGLYLAAMRPDLVSGLALINCYARLSRAEDYPVGMPQQIVDRIQTTSEENWGRGDNLRLTAPSVADDPDFKAWFARSERASTSPDVQSRRYRAVSSIDLRPLLAKISAPTIVIHRAGDRYVRVGHGRYLAEHIAGAKYVEVPGDDHLPYVGDTQPILAEIEELLTGVRGSAPHRSFATILFSDIVKSTDQAARLGDAAWRSVLDQHDTIVLRYVARFSGRVVKTTGDGFLATFDSPTRAATCALTIRDDLTKLGLTIRMGVHAAEIERRGQDIGGIGVHVAARITALADPGEILASRTIKDLTLGSQLHLTDRGEHQLDGVPGRWQVLTLE